MGYQTYHDALDEAQAEAEAVAPCDHSWLEHLEVSTGKVNARVCSKCGATAEPRPLPFDDSLEGLAVPMKIALDYDGTFTRDPDAWTIFIRMMRHAGHDIRIVTWRQEVHDNIDGRINGAAPIIYCNGIAKRYYCHHFAHFDPDIWIDDKPESILGNTGITRDGLANWRAERDH